MRLCDDGGSGVGNNVCVPVSFRWVTQGEMTRNCYDVPQLAYGP